jgi:alkaline phosphatase D
MRRRELLGAAAASAAVAGCESVVPLREVPPHAPPQIPLTRIAFGSCMDQSKPQPIWDQVRADGPGLVIFGGDNVYSSAPPFSVEKLREAYARQAAEASFARLRRAVPHLAIWDDNDYGQNDGGADFPHKEASKAAFLDFWEARESDPRRGREGIYHSEIYGPPGQRVQVILLDTRWFKSAWRPTDQRNAPGRERYLSDFDGTKTILGDAQWQWLAEQLRQPAEVRLLVSGFQAIPDGHGWERWGLFPFELGRLYRLIRVCRADGVVLLSGDRHFGAIYRETRGPVPYPLYEMTASGITHTYRDVKEAGPNRLGDPYAELHYGNVQVDWRTAQLQLQIKDARGTVQRSQTIAFDELKIRT